MFSLEGPSRNPQQNRYLAAFLSVIAGYVNSVGFMVVGNFTSHVTGSAGRLATDVVERDFAAAFRAFLLVFAFFLGAFLANVVLQTRRVRRRAWIYAWLLFIEALLLLLFVGIVGVWPQAGDALRDARSAILCLAMGIQNSLVTLISDARVRTTHLTGVVTDLGIESARWVRWWSLMVFSRIPYLKRVAPVPPPQKATVLLLLTIFFGFLAGAVAGTEGTALAGGKALLAPATATFLAAGYAAWTGRNLPRSEDSDPGGA